MAKTELRKKCCEDQRPGQASRHQQDVLSWSTHTDTAQVKIDTYSGKSHGSKHVVSDDFQQRHHQRNEPSTDECEGDCN